MNELHIDKSRDVYIDRSLSHITNTGDLIDVAGERQMGIDHVTSIQVTRALHLESFKLE